MFISGTSSESLSSSSRVPGSLLVWSRLELRSVCPPMSEYVSLAPVSESWPLFVFSGGSKQGSGGSQFVREPSTSLNHDS